MDDRTKGDGNGKIIWRGGGNQDSKTGLCLQITFNTIGVF